MYNYAYTHKHTNYRNRNVRLSGKLGRSKNTVCKPRNETMPCCRQPVNTLRRLLIGLRQMGHTDTLAPQSLHVCNKTIVVNFFFTQGREVKQQKKNHCLFNTIRTILMPNFISCWNQRLAQLLKNNCLRSLTSYTMHKMGGINPCEKRTLTLCYL